MKRTNADNILPLLLLVILVCACNGIPEFKELSSDPLFADNSESGDYVVLKRYRILDEMGFDKPVEAGSVLLPEGYELTGGIKWKSVNECRAEIVQQDIRITSPDGGIEFTSYPLRAFVYSDDPGMRDLLSVGERSGGCEVGESFDASQYIAKFAQDTLNAELSNVTTDETREQYMRDLTKGVSGNTGVQQTTEVTFVQGDLRFDDGREGIIYVGVMVSGMRHPNYFTGGSTGSSTTSVFYNTVVKFTPEQREDALKLAGLISTSSRTNPVWNEAKTDFLTKLGNAEHAGRMERIRLVGEQSRAYARSRDQAMDQQMRSWEKRQASQEAGHRRFVKSIREVETWQDSSGDNVDLQTGYKYGYSKPDGSYLLTDDPNFDPAIKFRQEWKKMEKMPD